MSLQDDALCMGGFDEAIIGTAQRPGHPMIVVYSYDKCIEVLVREGRTVKEAHEHMASNVEGAWVGDRTPIVVHKLPED